ncbi:TauD/TfdA family dioxygenase [Pantoea sp. B550]|jgi:hypothetical protein|uniref:TauD/TfdA family dioxygenase n=1 Tax=Pantoea TaxID=53335 RepID=UPI000BACDD55|nr:MULTISPECIES: TauD/TfdA family dioxygenase [Pantoea]MCP1204113.1 TauD/TfdA family dioxygenase [Pantoea sp. B550]NBB57627.1 oxygenase [Pantoea vagans]PAW33953.1 oxygenase [Pantoea vagans]QZX97702.1 TauD/TfdA family dioxygenase [Pantoea alfalfae]
MKPNVDQNIVLSTEESEYIRSVLEKIDYDPSGSDVYLNKIRKVAYTVFPERVITAINKVKGFSASALGSLQIDNLPVDKSVTGSPRHNESGSAFKSGVLTENILVTMGVLTGEPYSIAHEGHELVNNLTPHKEAAKEFTGLGSEVELDFHIENAAQAYMPEGDTSPLALILLGVRGEPLGGPQTRISDCRRALEKLSEEDIKHLYGKNFIIRVPYRWRGASAEPRDNTDLSPILSGPISAPRVTVAFYPDMVLAVNPRAKQALENLYQAVREVSFGVQISPGRLILINNSFTLHSRDSFKPAFDENDRALRWVQRIFVARNLWNFRSFVPVKDRVFDPNVKTAASEIPGREKTPSAA